MSRRHDPYHPRVHPARIAPLPDSPDRPFWSVMIPVHGDRSFLSATIKSVLAEAVEPAAMQIEVIDAEPGDEQAMHVVGEAGGGRVAYHRADKPLSPYAAWNLCIHRARGQWVHILHDDDLVLPGFYKAARGAIDKHPDLGAAFGRVQYLDEKGKKVELSPLEMQVSGVFERLAMRLVHGNAVSFPSMVVKRSAYETLGGFDPHLDITADWEMWMRLACRYPVFYNTHPLAGYRRRGKAGGASPLVRSGGDIRELHGTLNVFAHYLPKTPATAALLHHSREHKALVAVRSARQLAAAGDLYAATAQVREAFACCPSPKVIREIEESGTVRHFAVFLKQLDDYVQHHKVTLDPGPTAVVLREARLSIARQWTEFGADEADDLLAGDFGQATSTLIASGIRDEPLDEADRALLDPLRQRQVDAPGSLVMAGLVMARPWELPPVDFARLSGPVLGAYLRDALRLPAALSDDAALGRYTDFMTDLVARVRAFIAGEGHVHTSMDVATLVSHGLNLLVLRSTGRDLSQVIADRAAVVAHALGGVGVKAAHSFGPARPVGQKRRVAILTNALGTNRDTFEALPCFELDRSRLHVTAYVTAFGDVTVENLVRQKVDRFELLSGDLASQVREIRAEDFDALLIAADVTVSASPAAVLAGARLCRRQIATASYGLKPGLIPSIDDVWSELCLHIPPEVGPATIWPAREQLGLRPEPVVFASAANSLRVTPAVRRMWASILRDVPGSRLVLLPYSPQWGIGEYQGVPFVRAMNAALAAEKVEVGRMIVVNPLSQRQDVLAVLKLCDVYLDAFPESGNLSIYDALEAGLPPVTMGSTVFQQVGGTIAESEQAYHDQAVRYANAPEERDKLREQVRAATRVTPPFLDLAAFGKKLSDFLAKPPAG